MKNLPTRTGIPHGDATERQMVAQFDTDDFRYGCRSFPDGVTVHVKTRGGFVHYWTDGSEESGPPKVSKRGFAAFIYVLSSSNFINQGKTLISWVGALWKRVKFESEYAASTGYSVTPGRMKYTADVLPSEVSGVQHLDQNCHDVALVHTYLNKPRVLSVNTIKLRTLPPGVVDGFPVLVPVKDGVLNTYPTSNVDAHGYHIFMLSSYRAQHLWCYADSVYGDYEASNGAALPPLSDSAGKTFDFIGAPMASRMWEVAYTKNGSSFLNIYHRHVQASLSTTPPYVAGGIPVIVPRQFYIYYDMSVGATVNQSVDGSWTNHPTVPDLQLFDFFDALVAPATNGNPAYYNTYYRFVQAVSSPSVPGTGGPNQTDTRTFSNSITTTDSYAINSGQSLIVDLSVAVSYTLVSGQGSMYQTYNGGGPDVEVGNVPVESMGAQPGRRPTTAAFVGALLQNTANGSCTTYDNTASTSVTHSVDGRVLFSFTSSLTLHSETKTGWYATGRGSIGRGYLDGRLWAEDVPWASAPGNAVAKAAAYAVGWAIGVPDFAGAQVLYNGLDTQSIANNDTLVKAYFDGVPVTSFSRSSSAECRDYIFADAENGVFVFVKGTFSGVNTTLGAADGTSSLKVEIVVIFNGVEYSEVLYEANQSVGCNVGTATTAYVLNADFDPTHIPPPSAPSIYVPKCEQGDFEFVAYTTSGEHADLVTPRFLLSMPLYLARREQNINTYPAAASHAYVFTPYNLEECSGMFGNGVFSYLQDKVFHVTASHEGAGDWLFKINVFGQSADHYAECFRT